MSRDSSRACNHHALRMRQQFFATLTVIGSPLLALYAINRLWIRKKPIVGLGEKWTGRLPTPPAPGSILVHGVSLGEVQLMRPLVPLIERHFGYGCTLTTTTTTGWEALITHFADHARYFLPFDRIAAVRTFLRRVQPRAVILLEVEIWPQLLIECHLRGIPVLLLNARIGDSSFAGYRRARPFLSPLFQPLHLASAQNGRWGARLHCLGVPRYALRVPGSLKADLIQPADPVQALAYGELLGLTTQRPILLLASTSAGAQGHSDEEFALLHTTWSQWRALGWQIVVVPRHPERGSAVATIVERIGGAARRASQGQKIDREDAVLIVDEIGKLGSLYTLCAASTGIACVGGSFGSMRHGQNMLEAAAAGCCTVVGPDTRNFPDAMALLREAEAICELALPLDPQRLFDLASKPDERQALGRRAQALWAASRGTLARVEQLLAEAAHTLRSW